MAVPLLRGPFTVDDYHRLAECGILGEDNRVELLDGQVVEMTPIGPRHAVCADRLNRLLSRVAGDSAVVMVRSPVTLDSRTEPEPDIALLHLSIERYQHTHRRPFLAATAGALGAAALGDGFLTEPPAIDVPRHDGPIPGLPGALGGIRIACLAAVHLHDGVSRAAHAGLEHLDRERPEIVVLAGDICNRRSDLPTLTAWAPDARGTVATFATFGTWEHAAGSHRRSAAMASG